MQSLPDEDRAKGYVRPYRHSYVHIGCYKATRIPATMAEAFARDPQAYSATYCHHCKGWFPVAQFGWLDGDIVGDLKGAGDAGEIL